MNVREILDPAQKSRWTREVLETLPEWFGQPASLEEYIRDVAPLPYFAALDGEAVVGFFALKVHYGVTGDLFVLGVRAGYHRTGVGRALYEALGFEPLITLTEMWDAENPCLILVKDLRA